MVLPDDQMRTEEIGNQLRSKIASKFQTTAFLAGFSLTLLGIELSMMWGTANIPLLVPYAIGCLVFAGILYGVALTRFDGLSMPKRFWDEDKKNRDPNASRKGLLTDQDLWAIKDRMVFYWGRLVITALWMTAMSLVLITVPVKADFSLTIVLRALVSGAVAAVVATTYILTLANAARMAFAPMKRPAD